MDGFRLLLELKKVVYIAPLQNARNEENFPKKINNKDNKNNKKSNHSNKKYKLKKINLVKRNNQFQKNRLARKVDNPIIRIKRRKKWLKIKDTF